uniref:Acyl-coenzyme A oxidase n=1 Tax=Percolomonas cosmopolitus TaxID=63605 RepID=A0A7S1KP28_9EUKA
MSPVSNPSLQHTTQQRRLSALYKHLHPNGAATAPDHNLTTKISPNATLKFGSITETQQQSFDVESMAEWLLGPNTNQKLRQKILAMSKADIIRTPMLNLPKEEQRRITTEQIKYILASGEYRISLMKQNPSEMMQRLECMTFFPASASVKLGVQLLLFSGSLMNLGTERHKDVLRRAEKGEIMGAFGMTELAHGSAVQKLETTATYDPDTKEFVINTPSKNALKWWLGNAACTATLCSVFARLIVKDQDYGIHVFLVPIRDEKTKQPLPDVIIGDCGDKQGLHGVDNGFLGFKNVRIPKDNLLNRFGDVTDDGEYTSQFSSNARRFGAHMGELITGRVSIVFSSLQVRRASVLIATRYAARRVQFGAPDRTGEQSILSYRSHQMKLMPILASCYVYEFSKRDLVRKYTSLHSPDTKISDDDLAELHALSAGMKAVFSWDTQKYLEICREACGGHGYSAYNRFGSMINDHTIFQTFEGDNTVLVQQLGGFLMKEFAKQFQKNQVGAVLNMIGSRIGSAIATINPAQVFTNPNVKSSNFQVQAFRHRTASILQTCAQQINNQRKKKGFVNAWNDALPQIVSLARAYVEQYALEQYVSQVRRVKNRELRTILKRLRNIWALTVIKDNFLDFVNIINVKPESIRKALESQCEKVSTHAVSLVDAFNIPDHVLDAPIGLSKGNYMDHILRYAIERNPGNHENIEGLLEGILESNDNLTTQATSRPSASAERSHQSSLSEQTLFHSSTEKAESNGDESDVESDSDDEMEQ